MRSADAERILGPELMAQVKARPVTPLRPEQVQHLVALLTRDATPRARSTSRPAA